MGAPGEAEGARGLGRVFIMRCHEALCQSTQLVFVGPKFLLVPPEDPFFLAMTLRPAISFVVAQQRSPYPLVLISSTVP